MKLVSMLFALSFAAAGLQARAEETAAPAAPAATTATTTTAEPPKADVEGAFKSAPAGTPEATNVKATAAKAAKSTKKAAVKTGHALKSAGHKAAKGVKTAAVKAGKATKTAAAKVAKSTKHAVATGKAAAKKHHDAQVAKGHANDASHQKCDKDVSEKSGNAVGNPCLTSAQYAKTLGVKQKQVAKAHTAKAGKAHAKKTATH